MSEATLRYDLPPPGAVAWLDLSSDNPDTWSGRSRTGPLGMQIAPLRQVHAPYFFKGARLRALRSIWTASTVSGAELHRPARQPTPPSLENNVNLLARVERGGTVFAPTGPTDGGVLRFFEPEAQLSERFLTNTHLFTLSVPAAALGLEQTAMHDLLDETFDLTPMQINLLDSAVSLLVPGTTDFSTSTAMVGIDRYLAALAGLLLRTCARRAPAELAQMELIRARTDAIIFEQAADPTLTPATIAAELSISLRQLYRAFSGMDSPATRIRRRRLERAAELLTAASGIGQVEKVAIDCGFTSAEYFSRAFRKEFGLSPRAYRSAHREGVH
ncbi:MAG: helix-turn-helix domain-containing protein [Jatrophihabitans sp.]|uniref:helix-turn-helix domain-containing protein n=1 Tax=Jatrophihabitans sp. TaxID=1932789 RepID=UPI003F812DC3